MRVRLTEGRAAALRSEDGRGAVSAGEPQRVLEAGRRAPRGAGSTCLQTDAGSPCSADTPARDVREDVRRNGRFRCGCLCLSASFQDASRSGGETGGLLSRCLQTGSPAPRGTGGKAAPAPPPVLGHRLSLR